MRLKQLLGIVLAGTVFIGGVVGANAAELDLAWYATKNPDVVAAFGNSPEMLKLHYEMYGRKEARMANTNDVEAQLRRLFNPTEYAKINPDVKAALGGNAEAMFQHYMAFGLLEGRRPSEKVSKDVAIAMKKEVEKAMKKAGLVATPGSPQLVAIITGAVKTDIGQATSAAVQKALVQAVTTATTPQKEEKGSDKKEAESVKGGYSKKETQSGGGYKIIEYNADGQKIKESVYSQDGKLKIERKDYTNNGNKWFETYYYDNGKIMSEVLRGNSKLGGMIFYNDTSYDESGKITEKSIWTHDATEETATWTRTQYKEDGSYTVTVRISELDETSGNYGKNNRVTSIEEYDTSKKMTKKYEYTYSDSYSRRTETLTVYNADGTTTKTEKIYEKGNNGEYDKEVTTGQQEGGSSDNTNNTGQTSTSDANPAMEEELEKSE